MTDQRGTAHSEGRIGQTETALADLDIYINNPPEVQILAHVQMGMRVVDANGEALGRVEFVQFSDPEAVTVSEIVLQDRIGLREAFLDGVEPHVPEPFFKPPASSRLRQDRRPRLDRHRLLRDARHDRERLWRYDDAESSQGPHSHRDLTAHRLLSGSINRHARSVQEINRGGWRWKPRHSTPGPAHDETPRALPGYGFRHPAWTRCASCDS